MLMTLEIGAGLLILTILTSRSSGVRPGHLRRHQLVLAALVVAASMPVALSYGEPPSECQRYCTLDFESCKKSCLEVGGFDGCEVECRWVDDGCRNECAEAQILTENPYVPPESGRGRASDARSTR